jgi:diaminopimelate epimerase
MWMRDGVNMAAAERGSFIWFMMAVTQIVLSLKLMEEVDAAITSLFGTGAAACFLLALVVFRKEQREMVLNPMGHLQKEVHQDSIRKQGKGVMWAFGSWILALVLGSVFL